MTWAGQMRDLIKGLNKEVIEAGGVLDIERQKAARLQYRKTLDEGEIHCPPPDERLRKQQRED